MTKKEKFGRLALTWTSTRPMWGMIPLRMIFGVIVILEGISRFTFARMEKGSLIDQLPGEWAYVVLIVFSVIEILGGALVIPGFLSRFAGGLIMLEMIAAMVTERIPLDYNRGLETQLLLIAIASMLFISGAGRYSVDRKIARTLLLKYPNKKREVYTLAETPFTKWWE